MPPKVSTNGPQRNEELPAYAVKVRALRKSIGLTQRQLAAELKTTSVTISRWEGGVSEPRGDNCLRLVDFADNHNLREFASFFLQHIEGHKSDRQKKGDEADALRYLEIWETAAAEGDEDAQRLLELSRRDPKEFAKEQLKRMIEARQSLGNGGFAAGLYEIVDETNRVGRLQGARKLRALRRAAALRRQAERLSTRERELVKLGEVQRQDVDRILDEHVALVKEGKAPDIVTLAKKVADAIHKGPQARSRKRQTITTIISVLKMDRISELFAEAAAAEEKGEPLDFVQFTNRLEGLLEIGREPKKSKE